MTKNRSFFPNKIIIACDHAGYEMKEFLKTKLLKQDFEIVDLGCQSSEKSVDYPDYAKKLCQNLKGEFGILICGSGIGVSIAANRFKHIRAALCYNVSLAKKARAHNNANVICLGSRYISNNVALKIVKSFLSEKFEGNRHESRVKKLCQ